MNTSVDISLVILIAATMVVFSLLICLLARGSRIADDDLAAGTAWLIAANSALLTAAVVMLFIQILPTRLIASITMAGAYLGFLFGYFAVNKGAGAQPYFKTFTATGVASIGLQITASLMATELSSLLVVTSATNGAVTLAMGLMVLRAVRPYGRELALLVSIPFFAMSTVFTLRLLLFALGAPQRVVLTITALNAFIFAYSVLQWSFGMIALRTARLNMSLDLERQRAQDLAQTRSQFLAHMSREIRTPLNSVLGLADVLQEMVKQEDARDIVGHIRKSGDLLIHILNDVLDVSKLEANAVKLEQRPFDLGSLLHQIEASYSQNCRERDVALTINLQPDAAGKWLGDPHRISQILHNIVGNAVKFTEKGTVSVSASGTGQLHLVIEDTGIGMTEAQTAEIFNEFSQADEGITRRFGGTGLGMAIVRRLITLLNGEITVESQPGKGTRFSVTLPLQRANGIDEVAIEVASPPKAEFASLKVLCADDSKSNLRVLDKMLRMMGMEPQAVQDGHSAIRAVEQQPFDIYLLDISMPGLSGIETLQHIRKTEKDLNRAHAYAVAATANVLSSDVDRYISLGFNGHLPKPIRLEALRSALLACQRERSGDIERHTNIDRQAKV